MAIYDIYVYHLGFGWLAEVGEFCSYELVELFRLYKKTLLSGVGVYKVVLFY